MEREGILSKTAYDFSKKIGIIETIIIGLLAFLVPTFLAKGITLAFGKDSTIANNSQLIVGSIVNTCLILTAINLKGLPKTLFVVTMPSLSTIASGYIFGPLSMPMIYMVPAIWLGNFALIFCYKYLFLSKKKNYFIAGAVGVIIKVAIIFGYFSLINKFGLIPPKAFPTLQKAMSIIQMITASIGVILSFCIYKLEKDSK